MYPLLLSRLFGGNNLHFMTYCPLLEYKNQQNPTELPIISEVNSFFSYYNLNIGGLLAEYFAKT